MNGKKYRSTPTPYYHALATLKLIIMHAIATIGKHAMCHVSGKVLVVESIFYAYATHLCIYKFRINFS